MSIAMKRTAIAFALMPWYITLILNLITPMKYVMFNQATAISGFIFILVTPGLLAVAMIVAYYEGRNSVEKIRE